MHLRVAAHVALIFVMLAVAPAQAATEQATRATDFLDTVGVNTHLNYTNTVYAQRWADIKVKLIEGGFRGFRDHFYVSPTGYHARVNELAAAGLKGTFIIDKRYNGAANAGVALDAMQAKVPNAVKQVEGPSEWDLYNGGYAAQTREIWAARNARPFFASKPVLGGAMAHPRGYDDVGNLSAFATHVAIHPYPGGWTPSAEQQGADRSLPGWFNHSARAFPGRPTVATETGYHNTLQTSSGHRPVSERASGIYAPQMYLEYFRRGVRGTYLYELVNSNATSTTNIRANFGLLRQDLSEKPAFTHIERLTTLLNDPTPVASAGQLDYTLTGPSTLRRVLFQKGDGSYWLAVWNDVSVWDAVNRRDLFPADATATLTLPSSRAVEVYDVRTGTAPVSTSTGASVQLSVPASPLLVKVN